MLVSLAPSSQPFVEPAEIPTMPHIEIGQVWKERSRAVASTIEPARARIAAAATVLAEEYAAAKAIAIATRSSKHTALAHEFEQIVAHCVAERFLPSAAIPVPSEVTETLSLAGQEIDALGSAIV